MNHPAAYFAPLVTLPDVITKPGRYRTRSGEIVTITTISRAHNYGCLGAYADGIAEGWHKSGRLYAERECLNDVISAIEAPAPSLDGVSRSMQHQLVRLSRVKELPWPSRWNEGTPIYDALYRRGLIFKDETESGFVARITDAGRALWPLIEARRANDVAIAEREKADRERAERIERAAPNLLKALKAVMTVCRQMESGGAMPADKGIAYAMADAAIAEAEGTPEASQVPQAMA